MIHLSQSLTIFGRTIMRMQPLLYASLSSRSSTSSTTGEDTAGSRAVPSVPERNL
eukprot:COSAG06_NODE_18189_length_899_cov_1.511250_1_plen_54_part_10